MSSFFNLPTDFPSGDPGEGSSGKLSPRMYTNYVKIALVLYAHSAVNRATARKYQGYQSKPTAHNNCLYYAAAGRLLGVFK
ncbi:hypothetical protein J6590_011581 [Homalodisca vitripennis]|nr:hypothetical protein J6590_011581 [Homalodisca vitripennis]